MNRTINHQGTEILFGQNLNDDINLLLKTNYKNVKKIIITDEIVYELWIENIISNIDELQSAEIIQLPAGEINKSIDICYQVWSSLSDYNINRNDVIINIGGGVITDMGGFIASTYKRGIDFINIPTTLLSQVDASIGGKTGVNLNTLKNQIGTFSLPTATFIDYNYLSTLTLKDIKSGFAEMLKHGLIYNKSHWEDLIQITEINHTSVINYIYDSVLIKHQIVTEDPHEKNIRKSLNFGHTIGHAIESLLLKQNNGVPHGFAVAWGMLFEAKLSNQLDNQVINFIENKIIEIYGESPIKEKDYNKLLSLMLNDKKNEGELINFTLLKSIGKALINQSLKNEDIITVLA